MFGSESSSIGCDEKIQKVGVDSATVNEVEAMSHPLCRGVVNSVEPIGGDERSLAAAAQGSSRRFIFEAVLVWR